jgi:hypothetical protein
MMFDAPFPCRWPCICCSAAETRDGLWVFLGAVPLPPASGRFRGEPSRVAGTLLGVFVLGLPAPVLPVNALLVLGALALLPGIASSRRYPAPAAGRSAMATVIVVGAPSDAVNTWAGHRLLDILIGCSLALAAHSLLWPREQPADSAADAPAPDPQAT